MDSIEVKRARSNWNHPLKLANNSLKSTRNSLSDTTAGLKLHDWEGVFGVDVDVDGEGEGEADESAVK